MPAEKPAAQTKRKRTRKRKRRAAFSSSSSSSSSSDSSASENEQGENKTPPLPTPKATEPSSSDSESSSSLDSSDDETPHRRPREPVSIQGQNKDSKKLPSRLSPSPSPPPTELPSFLPPKGEKDTENVHIKEQEMKAKFRQFWMASVADGFRDDLEEIRKEPNLGPSRLALLIDSLASGADVFSSSSHNSGVNEMEVILG